MMLISFVNKSARKVRYADRQFATMPEESTMPSMKAKVASHSWSSIDGPHSGPSTDDSLQKRTGRGQ